MGKGTQDLGAGFFGFDERVAPGILEGVAIADVAGADITEGDEELVFEPGVEEELHVWIGNAAGGVEEQVVPEARNVFALRGERGVGGVFIGEAETVVRVLIGGGENIDGGGLCGLEFEGGGQGALFEDKGAAIFTGDNVVGAGDLFGLRGMEEAGERNGELFVEGFGEDAFFEQADVEILAGGGKIRDAFFGGVDAEFGEGPDLAGGDPQFARGGGGVGDVEHPAFGAVFFGNENGHFGGDAGVRGRDGGASGAVNALHLRGIFEGVPGFAGLEIFNKDDASVLEVAGKVVDRMFVFGDAQQGGFIPGEAEGVVGDDGAKAVVAEVIQPGARGVFIGDFVGGAVIDEMSKGAVGIAVGFVGAPVGGGVAVVRWAFFVSHGEILLCSELFSVFDVWVM